MLGQSSLAVAKRWPALVEVAVYLFHLFFFIVLAVVLFPFSTET